MKKALTLILSLFLTFPVAAHNTPRDWIFSANDLLFHLNLDYKSDGPLAHESSDYFLALGYVTAVLDHEDWCLKGKIEPNLMTERLIPHLSLKSEEELKLNASYLTIHALEQQCLIWADKWRPYGVNFNKLSKSDDNDKNTSTATRPILGHELLQHLKSAENPSQRSLAEGYIMALLDKENWCYKGEILAHEMLNIVLAKLEALPADKLVDNASELVVEIVHEQCRTWLKELGVLPDEGANKGSANKKGSSK